MNPRPWLHKLLRRRLPQPRPKRLKLIDAGFFPAKGRCMRFVGKLQMRSHPLCTLHQGPRNDVVAAEWPQHVHDYRLDVEQMQGSLHQSCYAIMTKHVNTHLRFVGSAMVLKGRTTCPHKVSTQTMCHLLSCHACRPLSGNS